MEFGWSRRAHILTWAIDNDQVAGTAFVEALISTERCLGGFRLGLLNYCGQDAIHKYVEAFSTEVVDLASDGSRYGAAGLVAGRFLDELDHRRGTPPNSL